MRPSALSRRPDTSGPKLDPPEQRAEGPPAQIIWPGPKAGEADPLDPSTRLVWLIPGSSRSAPAIVIEVVPDLRFLAIR